MNAKLRVAGFIAAGALAGALATIQLQAYARNAAAPPRRSSTPRGSRCANRRWSAASSARLCSAAEASGGPFCCIAPASGTDALDP